MFYDGEGRSDFLIALSLSPLFNNEVGFFTLDLNCRFFAKLLAKLIYCLMLAKLVFEPMMLFWLLL